MNKTPPALKAYREAFDLKIKINYVGGSTNENKIKLYQKGMYGSFSLVTGFIRNVFTEVSNSGRGSSSFSVPCKSHSHTNTDCFRFQSSKKVVAM